MTALAADVARAIRLVSLDVDGVLTDGSFTTDVAPDRSVSESRRFSVLDGLGIHLLREAGLEVAFVSGKSSPAVEARARELGVREVHLGIPFGKVAAIRDILDRNGWDWSQVAHLADDLADLAVLERAGLPAAVANAVPEVSSVAVWVGETRGGEGAVREFARALLEARGEWEERVREYVSRGSRS
ncbi:MAG: HAD hydrolase family protein [Gemmatimonadota bacterium]|nr:HAD hydrolase family protein [Gemmatimonadota bacterium]